MLNLRINPLNGYLEYAISVKNTWVWLDVDLKSCLGDAIREQGCTVSNLHYACFLGYLALELNVATEDEIIGDYGLVHELSHGLAFGLPQKIETLGGSPYSHTLTQLAQFADEIQNRIYPALISAVMEIEGD